MKQNRADHSVQGVKHLDLVQRPASTSTSALHQLALGRVLSPLRPQLLSVSGWL